MERRELRAAPRCGGDWQKAAKKNGLHFGVSEHLGASFTWFQDAHKADKTGPLAGVPYDGANSNYWDLYHFPAETGDTGWYSKNPRWQQQWYNEIKELVDDYHPDLLYSDGGVAFGNEVGLSQIANLYNDSLKQHHGKMTAVYNCKQPSAGRWVQDYERGVGGGIDPYPWQCDTSIGDWFYNKHWKYQPLSWTVHMLVDITSKNGNLLLNVVLRPDGSLDPEVLTMLQQLADWTAVNGEAIYGTRPWLVLWRRGGEGQRRRLQGKFELHRQGHPLHHERQDALRDRAGLAGRRQICHQVAGQPRRMPASTKSSALNCSVTKAR